MIKIIHSDVCAGLKTLENDSIDIAITSPPYWNQRDYGFNGQIGNEQRFEEYISKLKYNFNILREKLKENGVFFLNIGDKYSNKYGHTNITLIPYKLAYHMQNNGWILEDIVIWYKPNHMPSSIKNRFTNSYEPVFVFAKSKDNIYSRNKERKTNIVKVSLQSTPYKHVAVYPEKLVTSLINLTKFPRKLTVLDPFAGSGTTAFAVNKMKQHLFLDSCDSYMIEYNQDYIKIIRERNSDDEITLIKNNKETYTTDNIQEDFSNYFYTSDKTDIFIDDVNIFEDKVSFYRALNKLLTGDFKLNHDWSRPIFIGLKSIDIESIFDISLLNQNGWIVRNKIVVETSNGWYPLFMLVHDNKKIRYKFNYKKLNLSHRTNTIRSYDKKSFIGMIVKDSLTKTNPRSGKILDVIKYEKNNLPQEVVVLWSDKLYTKEFIINDEEVINNNLLIKNTGGKIVVKEKQPIETNKVLYSEYSVNTENSNYLLKEYRGKYLSLDRINWGASPGARASVEQEFFSVRRLYNVNQPLVCDYLNQKRLEKNLTKNSFTELFPANYKHTVNHWLRKDFGGSVPVPDDWELIKKHLDIDEWMTNYVCKTALKLQTVGTSKYKTPEDFMNEKEITRLKLLYE